MFPRITDGSNRIKALWPNADDKEITVLIGKKSEE